MTIWFSANNKSSKTKKKPVLQFYIIYCIIPGIHKMLSFRVYLDKIALSLRSAQ